MCTYVESPDVRILLDAGVSLCPIRFGLPPHPMEFKAIRESRRKIAEAAEKAEVVTISHYHNDHHTPSFEDWLSNWTEADRTARQVYEGKIVLAKNPRENINPSQRERGWMFQKTGGQYAKKLENADGKTFIFGSTKIRFSEPVFHGPENSGLGWVLMITIELETERFLFAPDVQGPMSTRTLETILKEQPELVMVGGPPSYLTQTKVSDNQIQTGLRNLDKIVDAVPYVILDHHILRDGEWREKTNEIFHHAYTSKHTLLTAAEFAGKENTLLEAARKTLFAEKPPTKDFQTWMHLSEEAKKHEKPPI